MPIDYSTVLIKSKDAVYSRACIVYRSTAKSLKLHLYDPSSATAEKIEVTASGCEPFRWTVSDPIDLSQFNNRHIMRYNDGRHGLFAFDTEDKNAVFYVRDLAFFLTDEDAKQWSFDSDGMPHATARHVSIMLDSEENLEKNGMLYINTEPYKTGTWQFSAAEQALAVTYTAEDYVIGYHTVGHYRLAPRFVKSKSDMLYLRLATSTTATSSQPCFRAGRKLRFAARSTL